MALRRDPESRTGRCSPRSLPSGVRVCPMIPGPCAPRLACVDVHRVRCVDQGEGLGLGIRARDAEGVSGGMGVRWQWMSFLGYPRGRPAGGSPESRLGECAGLGVPKRAGHRLNPGRQGRRGQCVPSHSAVDCLVSRTSLRGAGPSCQLNRARLN